MSKCTSEVRYLITDAQDITPYTGHTADITTSYYYCFLSIGLIILDLFPNLKFKLYFTSFLS